MAEATCNEQAASTATRAPVQRLGFFPHKKLQLAITCCTFTCLYQLFGSANRDFFFSAATWFATDGTTTTIKNASSRPYVFDQDDLLVFENNDCFVTEDICMVSVNGVDHRWIYKNTVEKDPPTSSQGRRRQPDFIFEPDLNPGLGLPSQIRVVNQSSTTFNTNAQNQLDALNCHTSLVPNHIVVTGQYIDMAMEVYVRLVSGLFELWNGLTNTHWWKVVPTSPHIQLYIHIQGNKTNLLPTMYPMMAGFSAHPVLNLLDIYPRDITGCRCFSQLVFCGYFDANARDRVRHRKRRKKQKQGQQHGGGNISHQQPSTNNGSTAGGVKKMKPGLQVGRRKGEDVDPPIRWDLIRNFTRQGVMHTYPNLLQRVEDFKRGILVNALPSLPSNANNVFHGKSKSSWILEESTHRLDEWTLIGFSQRQTRRRWLNLEDIQTKCLQEWLIPYKIICVEINLDSALGRVPENQVIMHAGLDALIGVHGSQQVHAVWMPDGAFVLELLPHLLGSWGQWTQTTERRTPNGKMLNHTNLNHVGYPLDASSVPGCLALQQHFEDCNDEKRWDNRDIWVQPDIVESFVRKFLVIPPATNFSEGSTQRYRTVTSSPPRPCDEYDEVADHEFVLYHVNCWSRGEQHHRHYFRSRDSFAHLAAPETSEPREPEKA